MKMIPIPMVITPSTVKAGQQRFISGGQEEIRVAAVLMKSHLQPATPSRPAMVRIPAPISDTVAEARRFPRKNSDIRKLVSDFLYHVDMVYRAPSILILSADMDLDGGYDNPPGIKPASNKPRRIRVTKKPA